MPIAVGGQAGVNRVGGCALVAAPGRAAGWSGGSGGPPNALGPGGGCVAPRPIPHSQLIKASPGVAPFRAQPLALANRSLAGVTRDSTGAPLASCNVELFITGGDVNVGNTTSDASGAFAFWNPGSGPFYLVAYQVGTPDLAGTSVNTLIAT